MCTVIFLCTKVVSSLSRRKCLPALQSHPHPTPTPAPPLHPNLSVGHRHARNIIALIFLIFIYFSFRFDKNRRFFICLCIKTKCSEYYFRIKNTKDEILLPVLPMVCLRIVDIRQFKCTRNCSSDSPRLSQFNTAVKIKIQL